MWFQTAQVTSQCIHYTTHTYNATKKFNLVYSSIWRWALLKYTYTIASKYCIKTTWNKMILYTTTHTLSAICEHASIHRKSWISSSSVQINKQIVSTDLGRHGMIYQRVPRKLQYTSYNVEVSSFCCYWHNSDNCMRWVILACQETHTHSAFHQPVLCRLIETWAAVDILAILWFTVPSLVSDWVAGACIWAVHSQRFQTAHRCHQWSWEEMDFNSNQTHKSNTNRRPETPIYIYTLNISIYISKQDDWPTHTQLWLLENMTWRIQACSCCTPRGLRYSRSIKIIIKPAQNTTRCKQYYKSITTPRLLHSTTALPLQTGPLSVFPFPLLSQ